MELWAPGPGSTPLSCYLPHMKTARQSHTLTGSGLACGGSGVGSGECELFSKGHWVLLDNRLSEERSGHSAWLQPTTNTTFLLGGWDGRSSETVTSAGEVAEATLTLKHDV